MNLKEYQECEKEILIKFDNVCKKYDIKYYLNYGTLLGAIRHRDFIPWDDDADVIVTRENYDKILNLPKEVWGDEFCIQNGSKCENKYFYTFLSQVVYLKKDAISRDNDYGEFISLKKPFLDIFVLDNDFDNIILKRLRDGMFMIIYGMCLGHRKNIDYKKWDKKYRGIIFILNKIGKFIPLKYLMKLYDSLSRVCKKNNSKRLICSNDTFPYIFKYTYNREDFEDTKLFNIGNELYPVPIGYDNVLKNFYGDYMKLPDEKDRKNEHKILDNN